MIKTLRTQWLTLTPNDLITVHLEIRLSQRSRKPVATKEACESPKRLVVVWSCYSTYEDIDWMNKDLNVQATLCAGNVNLIVGSWIWGGSLLDAVLLTVGSPSGRVDFSESDGGCSGCS